MFKWFWTIFSLGAPDSGFPEEAGAQGKMESSFGGFLFISVRMNSVLFVRCFLYDLLGIVKNLAQV